MSSRSFCPLPWPEATGAVGTAKEPAVQTRLARSCFQLLLPALVFVCLNSSSPPAKAQSSYSRAYTFTTLAGDSSFGSADGVGNNARFDRSEGVAADSGGNIYVADAGNDTIRRITPAGVVSTIVGFPGGPGVADVDGTNSAARNLQSGRYCCR